MIEAQDASDLDDLKAAYIDVQEGDYSKAYPYYKKMLDVYPKDPTYNYYVGRCLLYLDNDLSKAIKYLRFASTRNVPTDVYFYLGLSYLKTYQFEDATANFRWFEKRANKKQVKEFEVRNHISMAQNGLYLIKYFKKALIYNKEVAPKDNFYKKYHFADMEGEFIDRDIYFNQTKNPLLEQSILFVPDYMERNEVLYFSAKNKKRGDYDLYRTTRLNDTAWSESENLGNKINTPFDESYPFIHSDGTTLYFASKGHYSMGGYDLYKSSWSWEEQQWTEPENLDFPVNSPFDDILFVPARDRKVAYFASDRDQLGSAYQIYNIKLENSEPYLEYQTNEQIKEFAQLNVNIILEEDKIKKREDERSVKVSNSIVKIKEDKSFLQKAEYDSLLNSAINFQLKADSIKWVIDDKRLAFDKTENGQDRAKLGNEIINLERKIYSLQKKADVCYEKVRQIEQINLAAKNISYEKPEKQQSENNINESTPKKEERKIFVEPNNNNFIKSKLESVKTDEEIIVNTDGFGLRVKLPSIYNSGNPIKLNEKLPNGIVYMIQLGAYSSLKNPSVFKGLEPLICIKKENSNILKYFAGRFLTLANAEKKLSTVKLKGFKDAYIIAFNNGKIIPINSAVKLESENINIPQVEESKPVGKLTPDNLSIIYVIKGSVSNESLQLIDSIKVILSAEHDIFIEDNKPIYYFIIKSFATFDDALSVKKKVELILKKEIEIHAYFAENQIPLKQAIKITK